MATRRQLSLFGMSTVHCIQDTCPRWSVLRRVGVASDADFALLGSVASRRLTIAAGDHGRCCTRSLELVATTPDDPTLPAPVRAGLQQLAVGCAVASDDLAALAAGSIVMPGLSIDIGAHASIGRQSSQSLLGTRRLCCQAPAAPHWWSTQQPSSEVSPPARSLAGRS